MKAFRITITILIYVITTLIILINSIVDDGYSERVVFRIPNTKDKITHRIYRIREEIYLYNKDNYKFLLNKPLPKKEIYSELSLMDISLKFKVKGDTLFIYSLSQDIIFSQSHILNYKLKNIKINYEEWKLMK